MAAAEGPLQRAQRLRERGCDIGDGTLIWGRIDADKPELIHIGEGVFIAPESMLLCHGSVEGWLPVIIGNHVFIGHGAMILPGAVVPDGCVVGARAVVTKAHTFPARSLIAGNPARVMKARDPEELQRYKDRMRQWYGRTGKGQDAES